MAVAMAIVAVLMSGIAAAGRLPLGRMPDVAVPRVVVESRMPGLPAEEIRSVIAVPLEDALASVRGLTGSASVSRDGRVVTTLDFAWGEDPTRAAGRVREAIDAVYGSLPEGAEKPVVLPFDADAEALLVVSIRPLDGDMAYARRLAEYEGRARLRRVVGSGGVVVAGGREREAAVSVDMERAAAVGLTVAAIARVVAAECVDIPAGSIREGELELVAVAKGQASSVPGLADIVAAGPSGPFRISALADVAERDAPRKSVFVADGEECVALELYRRKGADPVSTARAARAAVAAMAEEFRGSVEIRVVKDSSVAISSSIRGLAIAGAIGAAAAAGALFLMLRDLRAGALVAASIPLSVAATLGALSALGRSLNGMSLGGISLAIGMISDNAVIVVDALSSRCAGSERPSASRVADVTMTAFSGTFGSMSTTAVVFVPVIFLPGPIGGLFGDLAVSIVIANVAGWLIAVFALPAAFRVAWSPASGRPDRRRGSSYRRALSFAMRRPRLVLAAASAAALAGGLLVAGREVSFMPDDAVEELAVVASFPEGLCLDAVAGYARKLSAVLSSVSGIACAYGQAGAEDDDAIKRMDPDYSVSTLTVHCPTLASAATDRLVADTLEAAKGALGADVVVTVEIPADPAAVMLGLENGSRIAAKGDSPEKAKAVADTIEARLSAQDPDALDFVARSPAGAKARIRMAPDREASAALGVTLADATRGVRAATEGVVVAALGTGGRELPIRVVGGATGDVMDPGRVPVSVSSGTTVPASAIARFTRASGDSTLARLDRSDIVYLEPRARPGAERRLDAAVEAVLSRSPDASMVGESAFRTYGAAMRGAMLMVLVLLYLTLGAQFESPSLPLVIMATIPLAMAGAGPALVVAGIGLDSGSVLGLVVLFGVVVNNAILLYEASSLKRADGLGPGAAAYSGAVERARPVLATTLTTVAALLPLCLSGGGSAQRSMSVAMTGGLVASTALTMFVSPVLFAALGRPEAHGARP